ncbi:rhomboid family intramembrane serine protease [Flavobacterium sp.]|uniref:rhomboid family intramembrane serine protease n=1 Tax=Flavobacterium sp. TaxID=239 RepID=UPI0037508DE4
MTVIQDLKLQYKIGGIAIRLIFWNLLLFIIAEIVFALLKLFTPAINYIEFVSLSSNGIDLLWKPWSIISYAFFHSGAIHLILNMLMLFYVGRLFTTFFTQKQLLGTYILSAIFSGFVYIIGYTFLPALVGVTVEMVGASGAIMAILFATVTYQPFMDVRLFGVFKLQLWQIAFLFIFIDLVQLPMNNTGGHIAHLAGALFGFIYIKLLIKGTDLSSIITNIIDFVVNLFQTNKSKPFKKVHVNPKKPTIKAQSKIVTKDKTQQQIDEILDKIGQSGYDSLTADEKEFLFKAGK